MGSTGRGDIEEKLAQARQILMKIPGVTSVAWGYKEKAGQPTQELCFIVMVREKKPLESLSPAEQVPRELFGIPTDVIRAPRLRPLACENIAEPYTPRPTTPEGIDNLARRAREYLESVTAGLRV
jgi:hypothetical protein